MFDSTKQSSSLFEVRQIDGVYETILKLYDLKDSKQISLLLERI